MVTKIYSSEVYMYLHYIRDLSSNDGVGSISSNIQTLCVLTTHSISVLHINSDRTACIYLASNKQSVFVMGICVVCVPLCYCTVLAGSQLFHDSLSIPLSKVKRNNSSWTA